jgi:hypothetical protein
MANLPMETEEGRVVGDIMWMMMMTEHLLPPTSA